MFFEELNVPKNHIYLFKPQAKVPRLYSMHARRICRGIWYNVLMTMTTRRLFCGGAAFAVLAVCVVVGAWVRGTSPAELVEICVAVVCAKTGRATVAERVAAIAEKRPELKSVAGSAGGKLRILVFKNERIVELESPGWKEPRKYPMTGFSGRLGPKLKEGDCQIPEGVYGIEYLNPNSLFHLSLKVSYPNADDKARAKADGRTDLGGDIMIHGGSATVGCIPVGDDAVEEIFYIASAVGIENISVVIAPYDMRNGRKPELERSPLKWYPNLCREIEIALLGAAKLYSRFLEGPSDESLLDVVMAIDGGYWDEQMRHYMRLELSPETRVRTIYKSADAKIDNRSIAVFLVSEMLKFEPPCDDPPLWCLTACRSIPDENEPYRGYECPYRIHVFPATSEGIALARKRLGENVR